MRRLIGVAALCATAAFGADYPVQPVPFSAVHFRDKFWTPRIETNRTATIPFAFQKCEETGRVDNFLRAATVLRGEPLANKQAPAYPFDDSDVYKIIEGAAYSLSVHPDAQLESYVDSLIAKIAAAQEKDGYLYTTRTIDPEHPHKWAGTQRWELEERDSHELYNLGHLYEAAAAYFQATKKRTLLDVSLKSADLLDRTFGPGKRAIWPGHQITEMGLVKLYRVTGEERYLKLAQLLLDSRGPGVREYNQSHLRVVDQTEAVGHAVRAMYMYSGMADVAAMTGDAAYGNAIDKIWENVVSRKLSITGGIGATAEGEAFGKDFQLPNMSAYNETCASIGSDFWNHRLFLLHADAKYIDVLERTLYNGLISGVSLDGKTFFYPNPLESNGQHERSPWFGVACCPSNMTRFLASLPGYVYARRGDAVYVNLFVSSTAEIPMDGGRTLTLQQETEYPWSGGVKVTVNPTRKARFAINVRIPGWARNEPVPSELYRFTDVDTEPVTLRVNGKPQPVALEKGFAVLRRKWKRGDVIELNLPMPVRRVMANERVEADRGRLALQRGPLVYAAEWADNPNGKVRNLALTADRKLTAEPRPELLNGVTVIRGKAAGLSYDAQGNVARAEQEFTAIPYYAWANRGPGQMAVWIPANDARARPAPFPGIAQRSRATASGKKNSRAMQDGEPDTFLDWWPAKGTTEWAEYAFAQPETVSEVQVQWFDDTGHGECRVPASWRVLYRDGGEWKPVRSTMSFGVAKDRYNTVDFEPVTTTGLRLEVTLQPGWSAGIAEWKVK